LLSIKPREIYRHFAAADDGTHEHASAHVRSMGQKIPKQFRKGSNAVRALPGRCFIGYDIDPNLRGTAKTLQRQRFTRHRIGLFLKGISELS